MVDRWVGYLLDRMESLGLLENTAILFLADHGFYLGERGYIGKSLIRDRLHQPLPLYPEVCHIPLLAYVPGVAPRRVQGLAQPVDLTPTILEFFGVPVPSHLQGRSLLPMIEGVTDGVREIAVASPTIAGTHVQVPHPASRVTVTDGEWLLVCGSRAQVSERSETTAMVDSIGRQLTVLDAETLDPHLFHLATDPACTHDVLAAHASEATSLHHTFLKLLEEADVPEPQRAFFRELA